MWPLRLGSIVLQHCVCCCAVPFSTNSWGRAQGPAFRGQWMFFSSGLRQGSCNAGGVFERGPRVRGPGKGPKFFVESRWGDWTYGQAMLRGGWAQPNNMQVIMRGWIGLSLLSLSVFTHAHASSDYQRGGFQCWQSFGSRDLEETVKQIDLCFRRIFTICFFCLLKIPQWVHNKTPVLRTESEVWRMQCAHVRVYMYVCLFSVNKGNTHSLLLRTKRRIHNYTCLMYCICLLRVALFSGASMV